MGIAELWRSFRVAAWLGWQIESNWTAPLLFAIYAVVKPLASAGILVVMYAMVTRGDFGAPAFAYMYIGNAFYLYVGAVMTGVAQAVIDDRERYRTLRSIYVAPVDVRMYLVGRGVARFLTTSASVVITLASGTLFLHMAVDPRAVKWVLLIPSLVVGVVMLTALGLMLAGVVMLLAHQSFLIGEAVAGALYLFTGAVFPLEVLPISLRPIGRLVPITYWLELMRRALARPGARGLPLLPGVDDLPLFGILCGQTLVAGVVALVVFRWCDRAARERGLIDRTTNY
jgi:ABC-2 type transport system permease protein